MYPVGGPSQSLRKRSKLSTQVSDTYRPQPSLRRRALQAGAWTIGQHAFEIATRLISNLIMTRLLFPEAFGAVAAALSLITGLTLVSDFGLHTVIIQSPRGDREDFLRSAWTFQLWRGLLLWIALCALCTMLGVPWVRDLIPASSVFADPSFPVITTTLGITLVLAGATSTVLSRSARHLDFRPIVAIDIACRLLSVAIMWVWAFLAPSVWALVGGMLVGNTLRLVLSHMAVPGPRMAFHWEKDHIHEIIRFGKWIAVSTAGSFVSQQIDVIILGILLPGPTFGVYVIAKMLVDAAEGLLGRLESTLALPILSDVARKRPHDLRDQYYRFRLPIELAAASFSGVLLASGEFVVHFLYDQRYAEAGSMVQILAIGLAIYPCSLIRSAFTVMGDTHIVAGVSAVQAVSMLVCMTGGFFIAGPLGAVTGLALHRIIPSLTILLLASRRHWISPLQELRIVPAFIAGVVAGKIVVSMMAALGITNIAQLWKR
jgi:O-antigen/teichoic acid export membrane protein